MKALVDKLELEPVDDTVVDVGLLPEYDVLNVVVAGDVVEEIPPELPAADEMVKDGDTELELEED